MSNDHLPAMMAPLKEKYIAGLHDHRQELCDFIRHCKNEAIEENQYVAMQRRAHGLATQGKTFGFTGIAGKAQALEALLKQAKAHGFAATAECAESLLRACDKAINANHTEDRIPE